MTATSLDQQTVLSEQLSAHSLFQPVDQVWQQHQAELLHVDVVMKHIPCKLKTSMQTTEPKKYTNQLIVRGDDNSFYRVLSLAVSGTEGTTV